jgi:hypothetical protein
MYETMAKVININKRNLSLYRGYEGESEFYKGGREMLMEKLYQADKKVLDKYIKKGKDRRTLALLKSDR